MNSPRYSIKITSPEGQVSYMRHRDRTEWSKRTAQRHAREFVSRHGGTAELEES